MTNRKLPSKWSRQMHELACQEIIRQTRQTHNLNLVAMSVPILVTFAGCYAALAGQSAGTSMTAVGTITTTICIPLVKVSSQESNRKLGRLMKEIKELD